MTRSIKFYNVTVSVEDAYAEGHTLTATEASALNQTRAENIRNNVASTMRAALENGAKIENVDQVEAQKLFDDMAQKYEFGLRTGRARAIDPIDAEAFSIAFDKIFAKLREKDPGVNKSDFKASKRREVVNGVFEKNEKFKASVYKAAKAIVTSRAKELDDFTVGD